MAQSKLEADWAEPAEGILRRSPSGTYLSAVRAQAEAHRTRSFCDAPVRAAHQISQSGAGFPGKVAVTMTAIALRESGGDPAAFNDCAKTKDRSYGLLQIDMLTLGPKY